MSEILNPEQIAALFDAAKQGKSPRRRRPVPAPRTACGPSTSPARPSSPPITSAGSPGPPTPSARRPTRACPPSCAGRSNSRCSTPSQLTWWAAQNQLPSDSLSVPVEVEPLGTRILLTAEQPFVLHRHGMPARRFARPPAQERRLSEIDWSLTRRLFESIVNQLSLVWQELAGVTLATGEIDPHRRQPRRISQRADVHDPDRVPDQQAVLRAGAADPVGRDRAGRADPIAARRDAEDRRGHPACSRDAAAPVTLRAEVASLRPAGAGHPRARARAACPARRSRRRRVTLFAENIGLARAQPGSNGPGAPCRWRPTRRR